MTATQEKLYNELSTDVINDDDSTAARLYEKYEDLPLVEQLALGFTPVVGETISAYETPIFARETKEAFEEGDYLKTLGKGALTGLAALGSLPLIGMGARGLKGAAKVLGKRLSKDKVVPLETKPKITEYEKKLEREKTILQPFEPTPPKVTSKLNEAVDNLKQKTGTGQSFLNRLESVSGDEKESIGLLGYLKRNKNTKLKKEDIQKYVSKYDIPIGKNVTTDAARKEIRPLEKIVKNYSFQINKIKTELDNIAPIRTNLKGKKVRLIHNYNYDKVKDLETQINKLVTERNVVYKKMDKLIDKKGLTFYKKFTIGPGKNYKDISYNVPLKVKGLSTKIERTPPGKIPYANYTNKTKEEFRDEGYYIQEHTTDINSIGRVRVADRVDAEGKSTKHLDEVQSEFDRDSLKYKVTKEKLNRKEIRETIGDIEDFIKDNERDIESRISFLNRKYGGRPLIIDMYGKKTNQNVLLEKGKQRVRGIGRKDLNVGEAEIKKVNDPKLIELENERLRLVNGLEEENDLLNAIPELPFTSKGNTYKYPIREQLLEAIKEGKDSLTITTGEIQFNRYAPRRADYKTSLNTIKAKEALQKNFNKMDKAFDEFLLSKENIEYKKLLGKRKGYGPNATVPGLSSFQQKLFNKKLDKARKKYNDKIYELGKSFFGEMPRNEININLMSAQDAINAIKNIDYFLFGKGYEKDLARAKQKIFKEHFKIPEITYAAKKYDNEYKKYLEKLAEKYNSKVDITDVDADVVGEDKAKAYRLLITPEMKEEFLNKGIEKLKEGGRVMKDYYNNYNTQRAI